VSRGFRDADFSQVLSDRATNGEIERILDRDREQAAHSQERRSQGTYGLCEDCNQEIGAERLAVVPTATRCVGCQSARDKAAH
jgi:DnaK suppressor protein